MSDKQSDIALSFLKEKGTNFPTYPKLIEDIGVFSMPDGLGIQFRGLSNPVVLRGALVESLLPHLLPLLDGKHDVPQLVSLLAKNGSAADVASLLMNLFVRGVIAGDAQTVQSETSYFSKKQRLFLGRRLGVTRNNRSSAEVLEKLSRARIVLIAEGFLGTSTLEMLLRSGFESITVAALDENEVAIFSELTGDKLTKAVARSAKAIGNFLHENVGSCDLVIAALRNIPVAVFDTINEICVRQSVEWLRAHDNGSHLEVGPYVKPYDSACFECMSIRQISANEHSVEEELYLKSLEDLPDAVGLYGESIALASLASSYLTQEALRIVTAIERPALDGSVVSFYSDGNIDQNAFTRVPRCEVCARGGSIVIPGKTHAGNVS